MIYSFHTEAIPILKNTYIVNRRTTWQIADPHHILIFIMEGHCGLSLNGNSYMLNTGDIFFIPANQSYTRYALDNQICSMIYFHFSLDSPPVLESPERLRKEFYSFRSQLSPIHQDNQTAFYLKIHNQNCPQPLLSLANESKDLFAKRIFPKYSILNANLMQILSQLSRLVFSEMSTLNLENNASAFPPKLSDAVLFMEDHITSPLSLSELCAHCGISKSQLNRYFKIYTESTAMDYFIHLRLSRAKQLFLTMPWLSVKEVSGQMGYDDPQYFSRIFHQHFQESPSHYRERVRFFDESAQ